MRPQRIPWPEVNALLDEALDLDVDARRAFVARVATTHPETARALEALLEADAKAEAFLETPAIARFESLIARETERDSSDDDIDAVRAGTFHLLRAIGRGGMGTVYLAERVEADFRQLAAVKVLRDGFGSEERRRRFVRERQILAGLQHDGIARMLDGGITSDGRPYFAMEFVEGKVLTEACDAQRASIDDRLTHFLAVCDAVAYLHRNLVVHRDLKPSNIMLAQAEGGSHTKLLDFGIAKLLADDDGEAAQTRAELRMFTPEYAAPEQLRGETITTATDVHALGLLLHELLTGTRARSAPEAERNDALWTPPRPSLACGRGADAVWRAEARGLRVGSLRKRLAGDLDRIVQHALEPDPFARYASVDAFAADVRRHLAKLPVLARGAGFVYVATRFVRRHRIAVAASVAVVAALITGLAIAMHQKQRATLEAHKAEEVRDFVLGLFRFADPDIAKGEDFRVSDLLQRGAKRVIDELDGQTEVQFELGSMIARAQMKLGLYRDALVLWERLVAWNESLFGPDDERVAAALNQRGDVHGFLNQYDESVADHERALAIYVRLKGERNEFVGLTKRMLGATHAVAGRFEIGEALTRESLAIVRVADPPDPDELGRTLNALAYVLIQAKRYRDAEPFVREAYELVARIDGPDTQGALACAYQLSLVLNESGRQDEAFELLTDVLARRRRVLPQNHPDLALTLSLVVSIEIDRRHYDVADTYLAEMLAIELAAYGPDHERTINTRNQLAILKYRRQDFAAAAEEMKEVNAAFIRVLGPDHPNVATTKGNLAAIYVKLGRRDEAEVMFRDVLKLNLARYGEDHLEPIQGRSNLGSFLLRGGDYAGAIEQLSTAIVRADSALGPTHPTTLESIEFLGSAQLAIKDYVAVVISQTDALARFATMKDQPHERVSRTHVLLGRAAFGQGRFDEAEAEYRAALEVLGPTGQKNSVAAIAKLHRYELDAARGDVAKARAAIEEMRAKVPKDDRDFADLLADIDATLQSLGTEEP